MLNSQYSINQDWLKYIAGEISKGNITITKAAKNAYVDSQFGSLVIQIPESTLRSLLNKNSIFYSAKVKRPKKTISSEIENIILQFQSELNSGETVTCHSVREEHLQITSHDVHEVFIKYNLFECKKDTEKPKTRCRYEAFYVMQISTHLPILISKNIIYLQLSMIEVALLWVPIYLKTNHNSKQLGFLVQQSIWFSRHYLSTYWRRE